MHKTGVGLFLVTAWHLPEDTPLAQGVLCCSLLLRGTAEPMIPVTSQPLTTELLFQTNSHLYCLFVLFLGKTYFTLGEEERQDEKREGEIAVHGVAIIS